MDAAFPNRKGTLRIGETGTGELSSQSIFGLLCKKQKSVREAVACQAGECHPIIYFGQCSAD